ncbi:MAG: hypothetical protein ACI8Q1_000291 [Parvicella sp.]|jgi:hypothetical protein
MKAQIQPIRTDSKLRLLITVPGKITKSVVVKENDVWIEIELAKSVVVVDKEYTHLITQPKKVDDNVNKKEP